MEFVFVRKRIIGRAMDEFNILVIDNDPNIIKTFEVILGNNDNNCKLFIAESFSQAKSILQQNKLRMLIINVILPEVDGYHIWTWFKYR